MAFKTCKCHYMLTLNLLLHWRAREITCSQHNQVTSSRLDLSCLINWPILYIDLFRYWPILFDAMNRVSTHTLITVWVDQTQRGIHYQSTTNLCSIHTDDTISVSCDVMIEWNAERLWTDWHPSLLRLRIYLKHVSFQSKQRLRLLVPTMS